MPFAAVTGLAAEAKILRRRGVAVLASAGDPERSAACAARLLSDGADALVSFGIAGGLDPALTPGALLLPRRVLGEGGQVFTTDPMWHGRVKQSLASLGFAANEGDLLGLATIAVTSTEKAKLRQQSGAVAIDLESHILAAAAARANRPFLVLRAVCDPADFALPPAAAVGLDAAGRAAPGPVFFSVLRRPDQLGALLRLARHTRTALKSLASAAATL